MNPNKSIIRAIKIGTAIELSDGQRREYKLFIESLRHSLSEYPETLHALEQILARPESKARIAVLEEELNRLSDTTYLRVASNLAAEANHFAETVSSSQNVKQQGNYNINVSSDASFIIGDSNNVTQSF
ncbi:MAG: hypothetical protein ACFBSF_07840 [Leptolyngbyaceae cyanobacterium]